VSDSPSIAPTPYVVLGRWLALAGAVLLAIHSLIWPIVQHERLAVVHVYAWPWWVGIAGSCVAIVGALASSRTLVFRGILIQAAAFFVTVLLWLPNAFAHGYFANLPWGDLAWWVVILVLGVAGFAQMPRGTQQITPAPSSAPRLLAGTGGVMLALIALQNATFAGARYQGEGLKFYGFGLGFFGFLIAVAAAILMFVGGLLGRRAPALVGAIIASLAFVIQAITHLGHREGPSLFWWAGAITLGFVGFGMMKSRDGGARVLATTTAGPTVGTPEWRVAQIQAAEAAQRHAEDEARQWAQAYRDSHDGAEPPADFRPPVAVPMAPVPAAYSPGLYAGGGIAPRTGVNVLAVLSLIFGLLGGYLAIPFGFIALSQIKKSSESGRGMAITGLVFGFVWIAATVGVFAWALVATSNYRY
jgi:hypothetical protein